MAVIMSLRLWNLRKNGEIYLCLYVSLNIKGDHKVSLL
jgi:hypothetical protein